MLIVKCIYRLYVLKINVKKKNIYYKNIYSEIDTSTLSLNTNITIQIIQSVHILQCHSHTYSTTSAGINLKSSILYIIRNIFKTQQSDYLFRFLILFVLLHNKNTKNIYRLV